MTLREEEVLSILRLVEASPFHFMQLEWGDLKLTVRKGEGGVNGGPTAPALSPTRTEEAPADAGETARGSARSAVPTGSAERAPVAAAAPADPDGGRDTVPIRAPMVGVFYIAPEPGAPPFVTVGGEVTEETTVGVIEVMKVFNTVKAGIRGTIVERCVADGEAVEYGQTLFRVRPSEA